MVAIFRKRNMFMPLSLNSCLQDNIQGRKIKLPIIVKAVIFFTLLASLIQTTILGFNVSGISWVIPWILSSVILVKRLTKISFPVKIWVPWILLLFFHLICDDRYTLDPEVSPLQRALQMLAPILVGAASSTYRPTAEMINRFTYFLRMASFILVGGSILLALQEILEKTPTGLATQVMTGLLLSIVFANRYLFFKETKDLIIYVMLAVLPLVAITRTVLAVILFVFPMAFAPMARIKRLLAVGVIIMVGVWVFYLPQIQQKMFYSGSGEITDVFVKDDFATTGRRNLWDALLLEAKNKPWFGHGIGTSETMAHQLANLSYPHNDWLLTYYDFGFFGVVLFLFSNLMMVKSGYTASKKSTSIETRYIFCSGISMVMPFMLVMFTDNPMIYSSFFGNLQYCILGLAYGALRYEREQKNHSN